MKKKLIALAALITALVATSASACGTQTEDRDLENVPLKNPQKAEHYANVNGHPNISRICIDGVAFATTTREYAPILRVPEWDAWCKS